MGNSVEVTVAKIDYIGKNKFHKFNFFIYWDTRFFDEEDQESALYFPKNHTVSVLVNASKNCLSHKKVLIMDLTSDSEKNFMIRTEVFRLVWDTGKRLVKDLKRLQASFDLLLSRFRFIFSKWIYIPEFVDAFVDALPDSSLDDERFVSLIAKMKKNVFFFLNTYNSS